MRAFYEKDVLFQLLEEMRREWYTAAIRII